MNEEEGAEEGKDDWSLEESISLEEEESPSFQEKPQATKGEAGASGDIPLWLAIIGIAIAPLLIVALFMARKQIEATREMGYAPAGKLYLALLLSLLGIGLYLALAALLFLKWAGIL